MMPTIIEPPEEQPIGQSDNFSVGRAALMIAVLTLLSRLLGFGRDILLASHLGIGRQLDIYDTAFRLPDTVFNLLILGTLSAAFVPIFTSYHQKDKQRAQTIANTVLNVATVGMLLVCLLLLAFTRPLTHLIAPGFSGADFDQTVMLTRIMLLSPLLFTIANVFNGYLTSLKKFFVINFAPILYNVFIIAGIVALYPRWGLPGLGVGVVLGAALLLVVQIIASLRQGYRWRPIIDFRDSGVRTIGRLFIPRVFALDISFISLLVASIIGSHLEQGSIAAYNRAYNLESVAIGIFALSIITALFPVLSSLYAAEESKNFALAVRDYTIKILYFAIPVTILTLLFRAHIVRIAYGHGKVNWHGTILIFNTLGVLAFAIVSQSLTPLFARAFFARHNTVTPFIISLISSIINAIVAYIAALHYGVVGIALGFTVASIFDALVLFITLRWQIGRTVEGMETLFDAPLVMAIVKICAASLLMGLASYVLLYAVEPWLDTHKVLGLIIQAGLAGLGGVVVYFMLTYLLGFEEPRYIKRLMPWRR
jgi:putative peptidoglycan lipid II flippase